MTQSYFKAATALTAVLLTIGFTAAQPSDAGSEKKPDTAGSKKLGDVANTSKTGKGMMPDLPNPASNVAKAVTGTVDKFLSGSIPDLGNALNSLLEKDKTDSTVDGQAA